jgi:hypothetical protein
MASVTHLLSSRAFDADELNIVFLNLTAMFPIVKDDNPQSLKALETVLRQFLEQYSYIV